MIVNCGVKNMGLVIKTIAYFSFDFSGIINYDTF